MKNQHVQVSESFFVCALLALTGGFLDIYTYLTRGEVFANAQTGNIVLLGLNIAKGNILPSLYYFFPILAFALGILFTENIRARYKDRDRIHWRQILVFLEAVLLIFPAFIPSGSWDPLVNSLISFVCGVQVESFRKIHGNSVATTMCTGNLRTATEQMFTYFRTKDPAIKKSISDYYAIILFFVAGAALGTPLCLLFAEKAILFCCLSLSVVCLSMCAKESA